MENVDKILILSDDKPGHLNQSIAFAKLKGFSYDILELKNQSKFKKLLSYILDFLHIYINLFNLKTITKENYFAIVSTGSTTYYANKYLSKKLDVKSIAIMLPKGFRYSDFDYIIAQEHDNPPKEQNIITLPVNLSINEPKGYIKKTPQKSLAIILGGDNKIFTMDSEVIKKTLDDVFENYPEYLKYITTSRRTPKDVEKLLENYKFDYEIIFSKTPDINPIPDFIDICDTLFISSDSTSMISEAASNSEAKLEIVMLDSKIKNTKYHRLIDTVKKRKTRINLKDYLQMI